MLPVELLITFCEAVLAVTMCVASLRISVEQVNCGLFLFEDGDKSWFCGAVPNGMYIREVRWPL